MFDVIYNIYFISTKTECYSDTCNNTNLVIFTIQIVSSILIVLKAQYFGGYNNETISNSAVAK